MVISETRAAGAATAATGAGASVKADAESARQRAMSRRRAFMVVTESDGGLTRGDLEGLSTGVLARVLLTTFKLGQWQTSALSRS
eukprot:1693882-Prymnesium_polylepis.1